MLRVIRHYLPLRKALLIVSETVMLTAVIGAWMSAHLWHPSAETEARLFGLIPAMTATDALWRCLYSSFLLSVLAQLAISFNELYDVRISGSRYDRASRFVESAGSALFLSLVMVVLMDTWHLDKVLDFPPLTLTQRVQSLVFALLTGFALLYAWRALFHAMLKQERFAQRLLILGAGEAAHTLAREVLERPDAGYALVGLLPSRANATESDLALLPAVDRGATQAHVLPPLDARANPPPLSRIVSDMDLDTVAVALEDRRSSLPTEELLACRIAGVHVVEQEALYELITGKIAVQALRPSYLIFGEGFERHALSRLAKRTLDVLASLLILFLAWPFMLATAVAVALDSRGPVIFAQERVGKDGRKFTLMKFRSMRADAEKLTGPVWAVADDPRITKVGRFIRKTRLDELPQLFNVCLLYTSPSPRDLSTSRMPSSA